MARDGKTLIPGRAVTPPTSPGRAKDGSASRRGGRGAKPFVLPDLNSELLRMATLAYRSAVEHRVRLIKKWEPRDAELRKLDEFHRTRVAWENASYFADNVQELAGSVLMAAARGDKAYPMYSSVTDVLNSKHPTKDLRKVIDKIKAVLEVFNGQVRKVSGT